MNRSSDPPLSRRTTYLRAMETVEAVLRQSALLVAEGNHCDSPHLNEMGTTFWHDSEYDWFSARLND